MATSFGSAAGVPGEAAGVGVGEGVWALVVIVDTVAVATKSKSPKQILNQTETVFIYLLRRAVSNSDFARLCVLVSLHADLNLIELISHAKAQSRKEKTAK